jgi:hypothetical protein
MIAKRVIKGRKALIAKSKRRDAQATLDRQHVKERIKRRDTQSKNRQI